MKDTEFAFGVSAVRVRETKLLSKNQFESLISSPNESSALKLLEEYGYSGISTDPEKSLTNVLRNVTDFINDISPDKEILSYLFVKNDFHNIKAAMKSAVSGISPDGLFLPSMNLDCETIKNAVSERNFNLLPEPYSRASTAAWEAVTKGMNGQLCEIILDRAAMESSVRIAEKAGDHFVLEHAKLRCAFSSLLVAARGIMAEKNRDFFELAIPDTSAFEREKFIDAAMSGLSELISFFKNIGYELTDNTDLSGIAAESFSFEEEYISGASFVSMGAAPIVSYYLRAEREVSRIRVILSCKRCGMSDEMCRHRAGL